MWTTRIQVFGEIPPGFLQHVLAVLVFWSWVLLLPRLPPWSRSLRLFPWASILLHGPLDTAWICCLQLPHYPCKSGRTAHVFTAQEGHTPRLELAVKIVFESASENCSTATERFEFLRDVLCRFSYDISFEFTHFPGQFGSANVPP